MISKTLTIFSLIGLLLSVGLWGVSYWGVRYAWGTNAAIWQFSFVSGAIKVVRLELATPHRIAKSGVPPHRVRIQGFNGWWTIWRPRCTMSRRRYGAVVLPLWPLAMIFGSTLWVTWKPLRSYRRRKRKKLGLCLKCGYDLRGSKDRCPECGEGFSK